MKDDDELEGLVQDALDVGLVQEGHVQDVVDALALDREKDHKGERQKVRDDERVEDGHVDERVEGCSCRGSRRKVHEDERVEAEDDDVGDREDGHVGEGLVGEGLVGEDLTDELGKAIQDDDVREGDLPNLVPCG